MITVGLLLLGVFIAGVAVGLRWMASMVESAMEDDFQ